MSVVACTYEINLPFVELLLLDGVDVGQERLHRFRMSLEEVEEGDDPHGLHVPVQLGPDDKILDIDRR